MRIALIIPRLVQYGPVKVVQNLVNALSELNNIQLTVYFLNKEIDSRIEISVPVKKLVWKTFPFDDFDIIHTNGIRPDLFAYLNRKKIRFHISTLHNLVFEDLMFSYNRIISLVFGNLWLFLWSKADKLVCVSESTKKYYERWYPDSKLEVIYNGINEPNPLTKLDVDFIDSIRRFRSSGFKIIGSAGMLTRIKGIDRMLYFLAREKEFALVIIGDGT